MSRRYDPNDRVPDDVRLRRLSPDRIAWANIDWLDVVFSRQPTSDALADEQEGEVEPLENEVEWGTEVRLGLFTKKKGLWIWLSKFTVAEIDALKEVIDRAFVEARGECLRRDAAAQEAYDNGDDGFQRLYRPVPKVFYRKGEKREHGSSLRGGPEGVPELGRGDNHE